jgi:predicted RNA-binding Zn-ribbon protein involved in translation (DUF1610 family)
MSKAKLRVCASCKWIFKQEGPEVIACPKCGFGHYSAHNVYGKQAYRYAVTQKPWRDGKLALYDHTLFLEIMAAKQLLKPNKSKDFKLK